VAVAQIAVTIRALFSQLFLPTFLGGQDAPA
jgi:hypothetical protein